MGGAIGGAVSGAILGAVTGGLEGALKGAAIGFVMGAVMGAGGQVFGKGFIAAAALAGAAYSTATGGLEGLGDFAAGAAGALYGGAIANNLVGQSTVQSPTGESKNTNTSNSNPVTEERIGSADPMGTIDSKVANSPKTSAEATQEAVTEYGASAQSGDVGAGDKPWIKRIGVSVEAHAGIDIDAGATGVQLSFFGNSGAEQGFRATYSFPGGTIGAESGWNLISGENFIRPVTSINYDVYPFVSVSHDPITNTLSVSVSGGTGGASISFSYE